MRYVDVGEGDPTPFLHGNPTSSCLWRNIIPHVRGQACCVAVDLIGMGRSDNPDAPYRYDDHYRYLSGFIDALGIGPNLALVIHDWGSGLGPMGARTPKDVEAIAFMETMIRGLSLGDMPGSLKVAMTLMRAPGTGWLMISAANIFLKRMLPDLTYATISPEALAYYQPAFPTIASRRSVRRWPEELPLDGFPAENAGVVDSYHGWLAETDVPKLLLHGDKGISRKLT
jgi:haloalkane dehalogenase